MSPFIGYIFRDCIILELTEYIWTENSKHCLFLGWTGFDDRLLLYAIKWCELVVVFFQVKFSHSRFRLDIRLTTAV